MRRLIGLVIGTFALLLAGTGSMATTAAEDEFPPQYSCEVVEAGPAGPRGDYLDFRILPDTFSHIIEIEQRGMLLHFGLGDYFLEPNSSKEPDSCGNRKIDVREIDRIDLHYRPRSEAVLDIDLSKARPGFMLAPGATPERSGSEIEVRVLGQIDQYRSRGALRLTLPESDDTVFVGARGQLIEVNLNAGRDGRFPDSDLRPGLATDTVIVNAGAGDDFVSGNGGGALQALPTWTEFSLFGGPGADRLLGHDGFDRIHGGRGRDLVRGLGGNDRRNYTDFGLTGGPGSDRVYGGAGNDQLGWDDDGEDRLYGGPGNDYFYARDGDRDFVDCGSGRAFELQLDRKDVSRRCKGRR